MYLCNAFSCFLFLQKLQNKYTGMTDEEEVCIFVNVFVQICNNEPSLQIPLGELGDLSTECKPKPHKHIALGFCRKQQVDTVIFIVSF